MLRGQCFYGDLGALGFRKTAFHGPAVAFFQNTLLPSRQPEKSDGEVCRRSQPERTSRKSQPQRKTNHSVKSFKTLQQAAKLCRRQDGSRLQISCNVEAAQPEGHIIHEQALFACEGRLWLQSAESAELHIRLTEVSGTGVGIYELRHLWACAAGSSAKGSPRARQTRELRPEILQRAGASRGGVGLPAV